jgi:hypothetical protein
MNLSALKVEITIDPLGRGYSNMTDKEVSSSLNAVDRTTNKNLLTSSEVLNAIDKAAFNALADPDKQLIWNILHIGNINPFGIEADLFVDIFGAGSASINALSALRINNVSRATELGIGKIKEGYVAQARA